MLDLLFLYMDFINKRYDLLAIVHLYEVSGFEINLDEIGLFTMELLMANA